MLTRCRCRIRLFGDGRQSRDFTYVADVGVSLNRALEILAAVAGRPLDVRRQERETGDARHTGADIARARAALGYDPATALEAGLRAELDWVHALTSWHVGVLSRGHG